MWGTRSWGGTDNGVAWGAHLWTRRPKGKTAWPTAERKRSGNARECSSGARPGLGHPGRP